MNEHDVTALLERRAAAVPASEPPIGEIVGGAPRHPRRHRHLTASLAAAAVLVVIVCVGVVWDATREHATSPVEPVDTSLPLRDGYRWVGMNGIAVEVPDSWTTVDSGCTPEAVDAVVFDAHVTTAPCPPRVDPRATSLHFETLDSRNFIAEMAPTNAQHHITIGGLPALLTDPVELNCARPITDGCRSVLGSSVEIDSPDAGFLLVWIESPDRATIAKAMGSIRALPAGYVAVPAVRSIAQSQAADMIGRLGLAPVSLCPKGGHVCDGDLSVLRTDPVAGTVVAGGTPVSIEISRVTVSGH